MEMMFNVRDTNLRKRSGKRDMCRLNRNTVFASTLDICEQETRLGFYSGLPSMTYIPMTAPAGTNKVPVMLAMGSGSLNIYDGISMAVKNLSISSLVLYR